MSDLHWIVTNSAGTSGATTFPQTHGTHMWTTNPYRGNAWSISPPRTFTWSADSPELCWLLVFGKLTNRIEWFLQIFTGTHQSNDRVRAQAEFRGTWQAALLEISKPIHYSCRTVWSFCWPSMEAMRVICENPEKLWCMQICKIQAVWAPFMQLYLHVEMQFAVL